MNWFSHLQPTPPDPILAATIGFLKDKNPNKINLGGGAYRTNEGRPYIFQAIRESE